MAADPVSSLFPNRPIRPLPKRRLRERLSPEVADSIQYPPPPRTVAPLFPYPYPLMEDTPTTSFPPVRRDCDAGSYSDQHHSRSNGVAVGNENSNSTHRQGPASRAAVGQPSLVARPKLEHGRYANSFPPLSTTSSADGYDPFENTNNKKRKIPTAGDSAPSGVHAVNDSAIGTSTLTTAQSAEGQSETLVPTSTPYYGSGSFASGVHNVPGPGRGRYGRPRSFKNQARPLFDSTNNWAGRNKQRPGQWAPGSSESTGIISTAIANAEKLPPHQGQENISLLHQQPSTKRSPASTQFTFTCDSQVPGSLAWPGSDRRMAMPPHHSVVSQGKENWPRASQTSQTGHPPPALPQPVDTGSKEHQSRNAGSGQSQQAPVQKNSRRSAAREYAAAAKARRRETQLYNKRHPPKPEEIWICHFCEYEAIFGHPPAALVRQYEIKDRKQRQLEQQRRAQWERMKKGKHKGRKNSKLPAKNSNTAQDTHHAVDNREVPVDNYDHDAQEEEYYDDEYYEDEEYDPDDEGPLEHSSGVHSQHDHVPVHLGDSAAAHNGGVT